MTRTRNLSDLLDSNGDVKSDALDNVISEVADDTTPALGGNLDVSGNSIVSSSNGDISITPNGTGSVVIDGLSHPQSDGTNGQFMTTDGAGNLSFGDVPAGVGGATGVDFNDSVKARFGTDNDLEIYHDGSHSVIHDNGTGHLKLRAGDFRLNNAGDTKQIISATDGGSVQLFYDNSSKLETASTGVNVEGNAKVSGQFLVETGRGIERVIDTYGSVHTVGAKNGWAGYSFSSRPFVLMSNATNWGIYDDNSAVGNWNLYFEKDNRYLYTMSEGSNNLRVNITQGTCKMWNTMENSGSIGTYDSYNVSSTVDQGVVGHYTLNFSNTFNNTAYSATSGAAENHSSTDNYARITSMATNRRATSYSRHWSHESWTGTNRDLTYICDHHMGDLA